MAGKKRNPINSSAELRKALTALSSDAISILKDVLGDGAIDVKIKIDAAKFIITHVLDDPELLNSGDNLAKLAEILKN